MPDASVIERLHQTSVIKEVELEHVRIDRSYQRDPSQALVEQIAADWDEVASELVLISDRGKRDSEGEVEGGFWLVNGQHRSLAARKRGHETIWARIVDLSEVDDPAQIEASLRLKLNIKLGDRPLERFKAQVRAGDEDSLGLVRILARHDTQVNEQVNMDNGINAIATVEALYRVDNGALLSETLEILREAFGSLHGKKVSAAMMKGVAWFVEKHSQTSDRGRLMEKIKMAGTEAIHRRAVTTQSTMGGSLWMNYYRVIVEFYNENLQVKSRLDWQLRGANTFSTRSKGVVGQQWHESKSGGQGH